MTRSSVTSCFTHMNNGLSVLLYFNMFLLKFDSELRIVCMYITLIGLLSSAQQTHVEFRAVDLLALSDLWASTWSWGKKTTVRQCPSLGNGLKCWSKKRTKPLNLFTYKWHSLADYAPTITRPWNWVCQDALLMGTTSDNCRSRDHWPLHFFPFKFSYRSIPHSLLARCVLIAPRSPASCWIVSLPDAFEY